MVKRRGPSTSRSGGRSRKAKPTKPRAKTRSLEDVLEDLEADSLELIHDLDQVNLDQSHRERIERVVLRLKKRCSPVKSKGTAT